MKALFLLLSLILFIFQLSASASSTTSNDICYSDTNTEEGSNPIPIFGSICEGALDVNCRRITTIKNSSGELLSDVFIFSDVSNLVSLDKDCGVDEDQSKCNNTNKKGFGPVGFFGDAYNYDLGTMNNNETNDVWYDSTALFAFNNTDNMYTSYIKNGIKYNTKVYSCDTTVVFPTLNINDANITSTSTSQTLSFTVNINPSASVDANSYVTYKTVDGTAKAGTDYTAIADGKLILPTDGNTTATIDVTISANSKGTFYLVLENAYNAGIDDGNATGTIKEPIPLYTCSNPHAFELRKNLVLTGDLIAIGNSNICADTDKNGICDLNQKKRNDTSNIIDINSTSSNAVSSEPSNLRNTSSAELILPPGATIVWAGLYWQGAVWDVNTNHTSRVGKKVRKKDVAIENGEDGQGRKVLADKIKFKVPNGSYEELIADEHYYFFVQVNSNKKSDYTYKSKGKTKGINNRYEEHYQGFKDVTELMNGSGNYWVADIQATTGKLWYPGVEAAWSLQIIYSDPNGEARSVSITDGYVGLYDNGNVGDKYAKTINKINNNNKCKLGGVNTGAYDNRISFDVGGFLTPSSSGFQTDMSIFVTESDPDGNKADEYLKITKKDGSDSFIETSGAWNYEITKKDGVTNNDDRIPNYIYPIGMTIKNYNKTDILSPEQTSTTVTFSTGTDRLMLGVVGFATDLRKPKLCYDYSYSQFNTFLTEDNNGTESPHITASVSTTEPVSVQLYVQNIEDSDILATGMSFSILDINTSQATYISGTTQVSEPGSTLVEPVSEDAINSSPSYIKDIQIGDLDSLQYFYTYYQLDPQQADMDMPIYARVDYNITFPLDDSGDTITIPYQVYLNSDIPLCSNNDYSYQPTYGIFNIVHNDYYNSTTQYYNLPTQVTSREGNFKVIALDTTDQDQLQGLSTVVAVELIAAEGFHITDAQCQDPTKSISQKVWVTFDNNTSFAMFNQTAIQSAITKGMTSLTSSSDFYKNARENTAFRVSYNLTNDGENSLVRTELQTNGNYTINFDQLVQGMSTCSNSTNTVASSCGDGNEMTPAQLASCMECVYGYNTQYVCSRDNFSIRPEALSIKVYDDNQSTLPKLELDNTISDTTSPSSNTLNLAAGYNYIVEVNATNYLNHNSSPGYTKPVNSTNSDISQYTWEPRNSHITSGCNDTNNSNLNVTFFNGGASNQAKLSQVGEYRLHMKDTTWTSVDSNAVYMTHHTGSHFSSNLDCIHNSNVTQSVNSSANSSSPLIGCNIDSTHDNSFNAIKYRDYNITFHPYLFDINGINASAGPSNSAVNANTFIYMADLNNGNDENMSYHLNGLISAKGKDNTILSNFVNNCYSEPLDIVLNKSVTTLPVPYQYRFHTLESNLSNISLSNVTDFNSSSTTVAINNSSFSKSLNGSADTLLNLNYLRTNENAVNPEAVTFIDYTVDCNIQANCSYSANGLNNETPQAVKILNNTVTYYYGRSHAPRQKFIDSGSASISHDANIFYEIYCNGIGCDTTLLPNGAASTFIDDPRWFTNTLHTTSEGTAGIVAEKTSSGTAITVITQPTGIAQDKVTVKYDGSKGYPFTKTMKNTPSSWLIYDKYDSTADHNEFVLEFYKDAGGYVGSGKSTADVKVKKSTTLNTNENKSWW